MNDKKVLRDNAQLELDEVNIKIAEALSQLESFKDATKGNSVKFKRSKTNTGLRLKGSLKI